MVLYSLVRQFVAIIFIVVIHRVGEVEASMNNLFNEVVTGEEAFEKTHGGGYNNNYYHLQYIIITRYVPSLGQEPEIARELHQVYERSAELHRAHCHRRIRLFSTQVSPRLGRRHGIPHEEDPKHVRLERNSFE